MAILSVRKYGDPLLRRRARPVDQVTPELRTMIANMTDTMYDEVGIGLAAPQVGISLRLIVLADEDGRAVQALLKAARSRARKAACRFLACSRRSRAPRG